MMTRPNASSSSRVTTLSSMGRSFTGPMIVGLARPRRLKRFHGGAMLINLFAMGGIPMYRIAPALGLAGSRITALALFRRAGDKPHRYNFTLHALKVDKLDIPAGASAALAGFMVNANSIGKATLTGRYGRSR